MRLRHIVLGGIVAVLAGARVEAAGSRTLLENALYCANGSTVCRPAKTKIAETVSVCDFESPCPSLTNDQAAVDAAYAATASGGSSPGAAITFPAGTFKFNLPITRSGVHVSGAGRCRIADTTPVGGTLFTPADLTKPVIQVGDGTALVEKTTLDHFCMRGDGTFTVAGTSTSDGVMIDGAYNTKVVDFEIGQMGGKCSYVTSSAARSTAYNVFDGGSFVNCSRYGTLVDYGSSFTTATFFNHINWSPSNIGSGDYDLRVEGSTVFVENSWLQVGDGHAHLYLLKDAGGRSPSVQAANLFVDTGGNQTYNAVDINLAGAVHTWIGNYIQAGPNTHVDGKVRWDDGTVYDGSGLNTVPIGWRFPVAKINNQLWFDIAVGSGVAEQNDASSPTMFLRGGERVTSGGVTYLEFAGGHFRIPGTSSACLQFGTGGCMWRNATSGGLRYRPDFPWPGNDIDGVPVSPVRKAITYSSNMAVDATFGTFIITATNGTAFTINTPSNAATNEEIDFQVINTSGGALGAATWGGGYKMVAWVQPANGFSRWIRFRYDGTNWIEMYRSAADLPN